MKRALVLTLALGGCSMTPLQYVGHAAAPLDGREMHTCGFGRLCEEGWACTRHGCEWCGGDDGRGIATRCTEGTD